jgi:hypothetical protein
VRRIAGALPLGAALAVLAAYAVLLPAGRWQGDEYFVAWRIAHDGWRALADRLTGSSPRPVAETLTWLYLRLSNALDAPLIGWLLGLLWLGALIGVVAAGRAARLQQPAMLALVLFALALLLGKPGEMFYWPMGVMAYVPCWAALAAATVLHRGDPARHGFALAVALTVAAFSAEIGAVTVLFYAGLAGIAFARARAWRRLAPSIVPALGAASVCLIVLRQRMQPMGEVMDAASGLAGNWPASLRATIPSFARESIAIDGLPLLAGAAIKLLLVLCLPAAQPAARRDARSALAWICALLLAAFASVALAYHQFGTLCCERHATLRQGMILLALATLGGLLGGALRVPRNAALAGVLLGLLLMRAPALRDDWRLLPDIVAARRGNWASGQSGGDAMTVRSVAAGRIVNADALPAGQYRRSTGLPFGDTPWFAWGVMARFGKHALTIEPAP